MASQALYRKYRSKNLQEIVGQEHIVEVLKNAIKQEKISHAYLFTGPRGTGKTSIARIFAHEINNVEYSTEKTHLDIIEIDAASNSGVDDMRDLREKITSAPASLKFKVYIIDEVHMLSGASFAALLKTIEEPPSHAVFILATTDAHKVPATIMSRVQKFFFRPIDLEKVEKHLCEICKKEGIDFEPEAIKLIATSTEGSMRDAQSLLDQVASSGKKIDLSLVQDSLGLAEDSSLNSLISSVLESNNPAISQNIEQLISNGADPKSIAYQCYENLKNKLQSIEEITILGELLTLGSLTKPKLGLELTLLKLSAVQTSIKSAASVPKPKEEADQKEQRAAVPALIETETPPESITVSNKEIKANGEIAKQEIKEDSVTQEPDEETELITLRNLSEKWNDILDLVAKKSPSLKAVLKPASVKLTEKTYSLNLKMIYPIHLKMINEAKNKRLFQESFNECGLRLPKIEITLAEKKAQKSKPLESEDHNKGGANADLSDIIGLMGGGEAIKI